jgi:hypothetical protein
MVPAGYRIRGMSIQERVSRVGYAVAASASLCAVLLLATAPAKGQNSRSRAEDPEAHADAKLTSYLKSAGLPATNAAGARQMFIDKYCADCHNSIDVAGSLDLSIYETEKLGPESEVW